MFFIFKDRIPPKKNSKRKYNGNIIPSLRYIEWNKQVVANIENFVYFDKNEKKDLYKFKNEKNLKLKATFFLKNKRKFDLTNVLQSIEDTLSDAGIIEDDNFNVLSGFEYYIDKEIENSEVFAIVELSKLTKREIDKKRNNTFSKFYNILENENIEDFQDVKLPKTKVKVKKKKKHVFIEI